MENAAVAVQISDCVHVKLASVWHPVNNQRMVAIVFISWS